MALCSIAFGGKACRAGLSGGIVEVGSERE